MIFCGAERWLISSLATYELWLYRQLKFIAIIGVYATELRYLVYTPSLCFLGLNYIMHITDLSLHYKGILSKYCDDSVAGILINN